MTFSMHVPKIREWGGGCTAWSKTWFVCHITWIV